MKPGIQSAYKMCELKCENCALAFLHKSGDEIGRADYSGSRIFTKGDQDFIQRDCVKATDNNWEEKELADPGATCIFPERYQAKSQEIIS